MSLGIVVIVAKCTKFTKSAYLVDISANVGIYDLKIPYRIALANAIRTSSLFSRGNVFEIC